MAHWTRKPIDPEEAIILSKGNKNAVQESDHVGCYACCENNINPTKIVNWVEDDDGNTGICPCCGIDSILPNSPTDADLKAANEVWFS